ncbi:MAG: hypothetical protein IJN70_06465 [Clostridia bacterium]|nr:hypothetical protein [Clostridia bacterium]
MSAYSDDDPLITLSYLQQIFAPSFKQEIITEVTGTLQDDTEPETIPAATESENVPENIDNITNNTASNTYTLLELSLGQTVMADSICEFIVRPGSKVTAVSPFPSQGIADITNGIEVLGGEQIAITPTV